MDSLRLSKGKAAWESQTGEASYEKVRGKYMVNRAVLSQDKSLGG